MTGSFKIDIRSVSKTYRARRGVVEALRNINLTVADGEFVSLIGPSGCGKSTLLRILAGLYEQSSGDVVITASEENHRPLNSVVFQEYAIFPWRTALDNVAFGLEMRGISKAERREIAREHLALVGLTRFADHYPYQLSGGMRQRVALARALANDPEILLMDEPFGALDAQTRETMQDELLRIWQANRKTVVYVTHSIDEAVILGDRVVLMTSAPGEIKAEYQIDLPRPRESQVRATLEFTQIAQVIRKDLSEEVTKAQAFERGDA